MSEEEGKNHILIPALIAAIAAYFGFRKKSELLGAVAQDLVTKAIKDQTEVNTKAKNQKKISRWKRHKRRYYR